MKIKQRLSDSLKLQRGDRMALVGGGGKTSLLYTLAEENAFARGLYTTSTKMFNPSSGPHPFHRLLIDWQEQECPVPMYENESCFVAGPLIEGDRPKVSGLSNKRINSWKNTDDWPILVIEADGAAGKPVKAPREGEPVIPESINRVVGCIGLDALGKEISPSWVHRPELFRERFCKKQQDRIDQECLLELIYHPDGLFRNTPAGAVRTVILNKTDRLDSAFNLEELLEMLRGEMPYLSILAVTLI